MFPSATTKRIATALLAVPILVGATAGTASAATVTASPKTSWAPWKKCATGTENCAQVRSVVTIPGTDRVVLAGDFTELRSPSGASVPANRLAVLDQTTGQLDPTFTQHTFNSAINSVEVDAATNSLYVAGAFTQVDGKFRSKLARLDATTGALTTSYKHTVTGGNVYALLQRNGKLYLGGTFTKVQGQLRGALAAVDAATGVLDSTWTPTAVMTPDASTPNNASHNTVSVRDIDASADGSRIYIAGDFDVVNGVAGRSTVAALDASGQLDPSWTQSGEFATNSAYQGMALAVVEGDAARAGVVLAGGGPTNRAWRLTPGGDVRWRVHADGDVQAVAVSGDTVYMGGHFVCVSTVNCYDKLPDGSPDPKGDARRNTIAAFPYTWKQATGTAANPPADPTWAPSLGPLNRTKTSLKQPYYYGVWSLHVSQQGDLFVGGAFGNVTAGGKTYKQPKFVEFATL